MEAPRRWSSAALLGRGWATAVAGLCAALAGGIVGVSVAALRIGSPAGLALVGLLVVGLLGFVLAGAMELAFRVSESRRN